MCKIISCLQFFTTTVLKWIPVLHNDRYKQIIIDSLSFLTINNRCKVYGLVIMPNHIHLIWQINENHKREDVQRDFLKYTSQQIRFGLQDTNSDLLPQFEVNLKDRKYQIWQRNPLSIDLLSRKTIEQKLDYIHANPVKGKWMLADDFVQYHYSSAAFYEEDNSEFKFLKHYMELFE
ncbi:transposase [Roseivirga echinicomitans]|uniref:Transposase n=1 Tax=Roseivirga echinicomitans TaxID=296218 RepID=A0A150XQ76_9BACT|nr:transposase [Roseivirga echinicomitans]